MFNFELIDTIVKSCFVVYILKITLKHNLYISSLKIKVKFLGLDIEIKNKEKDTHRS